MLQNYNHNLSLGDCLTRFEAFGISILEDEITTLSRNVEIFVQVIMKMAKTRIAFSFKS